MQKHIIIVAGGKGLRMNMTLPKQFIPIQGKPTLMYTIEAFYNYDASANIVVVLPEAEIPYWDKLCKKYSFEVNHTIATGGETRFHSVLNGLNTIETSGLVAIHDGVRPFVSGQTIENCFETAAKQGNAIPVIEPVDSLREITEDGNKSVDRSRFRLVQTPQVFDTKKLKEAYEAVSLKDIIAFTDDASVFSAAGHPIYLTKGNRENIKITTSFDLLVAEAIVKEKQQKDQ